MRYARFCFGVLTVLLTALFGVACGDKPGGGGGKDPGGKSSVAWSLPAPLVQKVEVSANGTVLESYEYTYDESGRILTLRKTDKITSTVLLDLAYTYPDATGMRATGKFYPLTTNRYVSAVLDAAERKISYGGSWTGAGAFVTTFDAGGTATGTASDATFAAKGGQYSSESHYAEAYTVAGGCIRESVLGTEVRSQTSQKTSAATSSSLTVSYTYSEREDRQNFAVYLFPCEFPVWVAAGLPGCKKLVTGITMASGSVPSPASTQIAYTFDESGDIDTATRTDLNDGAPYLVRTYKFYYQ